MLELSHGEIGWDVFTLEYKVDAPVDVIVTPYCARQYLKVFNFLWRVKRVEFAITGAWKRQATGARGVLREVEGKVGQDWRLVRGSCGEMIHFLCQLQYYILFEVPFPSPSVSQISYRWVFAISDLVPADICASCVLRCLWMGDNGRSLNHLGIRLCWRFLNRIVHSIQLYLNTRNISLISLTRVFLVVAAPGKREVSRVNYMKFSKL